MKRCAVGRNRISAGWLLAIWAPLFWALSAQADPPRRLWFWEPLVQAPQSTDNTQRRHQVGFLGVSYGEAVATEVHATLDLNYFEVTATAAQRFFGAGMPAIPSENRNFAVDISRYRVSPRGIHGRLSAGILPFTDSASYFWKIGLTTGILASAEVPYEFRLNMALLLSSSRLNGAGGGNDYSVITADTARTFFLGGGRRLQVGGFFTWGQVVKVAAPSVVHEYLLFSLGPSVSFQSSGGRVTLAMPLRVWVDKTETGGFLSDYASPAAYLSWQAVL